MSIGIFIDDEDEFAKDWANYFKNIPNLVILRPKIPIFLDEKTRPEIKDGILRFIARLRAVNKKVFILETGGLPQPSVYPETNAVLPHFYYRMKYKLW